MVQLQFRGIFTRVIERAGNGERAGWQGQKRGGNERETPHPHSAPPASPGPVSCAAGAPALSPMRSTTLVVPGEQLKSRRRARARACGSGRLSSLEMGEPPVFTTRAQVFQIDPRTKMIWVPLSRQAVAVSYFYDATRNSYRIISVDGDRVILHSTITPNTAFTKTSQRFGQWADRRANTMFGLGFSSDQQLTEFAEKFQEVKEAAKLAREKSREQVGPSNNHWRASRVDGAGGATAPPAGPAHTRLQAEEKPRAAAGTPSAAQLAKWELELRTLRHSNAQLSSALQDSAASAELWKQQVCACRQENERLRQQSEELERQRGEGGGAREGAAQLESRIQALESQLRAKEAELKELRKQSHALPPTPHPPPPPPPPARISV